MWGSAAEERRQWSFWSVGDAKTGGVAIFIKPLIGERFEEVDTGLASARQIAADSAKTKLVNVYATSAAFKSGQDEFFRQLQKVWRPEGKIVVFGGDSNSVLQAGVDRHHLRKPATTETESAVLEESLVRLGLVDSLADMHDEWTGRIEDDEYRKRYFTFGTREHGRRLNKGLNIKEAPGRHQRPRRPRPNQFHRPSRVRGGVGSWGGSTAATRGYEAISSKCGASRAVSRCDARASFGGAAKTTTEQGHSNNLRRTRASAMKDFLRRTHECDGADMKSTGVTR